MSKLSKIHIIEEDMSQLPPKYYARPNSVPRFLLSLLTLAIMLAVLPIGVYLVGHRTNVLPQASSKVERLGVTSLTLEEDPSLGIRDNAATTSAQVVVDLLVHSDENAANLFATRVNYPSQNLELIKISTSSAQLQNLNQKIAADKWIQASVENSAGQADFIAGVASPGIKTNVDDRYLLATLTFKVKAGGNVVLHLDPDSTIFANVSNTALEVRKNDLTINLPEIIKPSPSPQAKKSVAVKADNSSLELISPQGGETIPYTTSSTINWKEQGLSQLSVNLLVNGEKLGRIASAAASLGKMDFRPADFLLPSYLTATNTFQIQLEGQTAKGDSLTDQSAGPFAIVNQDTNIVATQAANLARRGGDANKDGIVDLTDLSILLSSFGKSDNLDLGVDLNGDGAVNDVDLWLFRGVLLK